MSDSNSAMRCRPAGAGKQCAAAFVDCGFVLLCGVIAALLGHNIPVTFLVMLESVAVLAIGEGSRGLTPGNMMFGLRTVCVRFAWKACVTSRRELCPPEWAGFL